MPPISAVLWGMAIILLALLSVKGFLSEGTPDWVVYAAMASPALFVRRHKCKLREFRR